MAKPETGQDGTVNLMVWHCTIPGKAGVSINREIRFLQFSYSSACFLLVCISSNKKEIEIRVY